MASRLEGIIVDSDDPRRLAEFWCAVLGYTVYADNNDGKVEIGPDPEIPDRERLTRLRTGPDLPNIAFVRVPEPKAGKNRLHFDIAPIDSNQDTELTRLIELGAKKTGTDDEPGKSWVVLADPEGNEFCLVRSLAPGSFSL